MGRGVWVVCSVALASLLNTALAFEKHINCGAGDYTAVDGTVYVADSPYTVEGGAGYTNGDVSTSSEAIAGTDDDALYQTERWGVNDYRLDLPNGLYRVTLRFAETHLGAPDARVFSVWLEGHQVLTNLDIYLQAGWAHALDYSFVTEVRDEQLNIQARSMHDHPSFAAISVKSLVTPQPQELALKGFDVELTGAWKVACRAGDAEDAFAAQDFTNACARLGLTIGVTDTAVAVGARVVLANPLSDPYASRLCAQCGAMPDIGLGREGYLLEVFPDNLIVISATNSAGLFYGVQTLKQLLTASNGVVSATGVSVRDWPDREIRGVDLFAWPLGVANGVAELKQELDRMAALKMNLAMFPHGALWRLDEDHFNQGRPNRELFQELFAYARQRHIEPVPELQSFGVSDMLLMTNAHCAEGVWVRDEPFRFLSDVAVSENPTNIPVQNPGFETDGNGDGVPDGWLFYTDADYPSNYWVWDNAVSHSGTHSVRVRRTSKGSSNPLVQSITVQSQTIYHLSFYGMKSQGSTPDDYGIAVSVAEYDGAGHYIVEHFIPVRSVDYWDKCEMSFLTQSNCAFVHIVGRMYESVGAFWIDDVSLQRMNGRLLNVVRTPSADLQITDAGKTRTFVEGADYQVNGGLMQYPYGTANTPASITRIPSGSITNGQHVLVSYDSVLQFNQYFWKAPYCPSEPETYEIFFAALDDVIGSLSPCYLSIGHDEICGMNRDSRCRKRGLSNAALLAEDVNRLNNHVHQVDPGVRLMMWDDMIGPYHNGAHDYYQPLFGGPWGSTADAAMMISNDVIPLVWWYDPADNEHGKMSNSPSYFAGLGFDYVVSPWFNYKNIRDWSAILRAEGKGLGMIDTTWDTSIRDLGVEPTADYAWCFKPSPIATASSCQSEDYQAGRAIDGDFSTRWSSEFSDPQWLSLDFIRTRVFNTVRLHWEAAYGRQYQIQVSDDGASWATIHSETNSDGGLDVIDVGVRTSRYVRVYGTQRGIPAGYSLWEFEVGDFALRGYWPGDEIGGADLADLSGNLQTGTVYGAARVDGRAGRALAFDGADDYAEIPDAPGLSPVRELTIDLCFKFGSIPAWWNRLVSKGVWAADNRQTSYLIVTGQNEPTVAFQIYLEGGDIHTVWSPVLETNRWYHLVGTYASGRLRLYLGGQPVDEDTSASGSIQRVSHTLCLGANSGHGENFHGAIDEVKIFGRELNPSEVLTSDSDRDGIPDSAEGGSTPYVVGVNDQASDTDQDGASNYHEYLAGSSAADSNSVFAGECGIGPAGNVTIRWPSATGRRYAVERATDVSVRDYLPLAADLPATPPENTFTDRVSGVGPYYYRVKAAKP